MDLKKYKEKMDSVINQNKTHLPMFENRINTYFDSTINVCRSPYYENNKAILLEFFGSENCRYNDYDIDCIWNDSFQAKANQSGNVAVRINNNWYAQVFYEGALYVNGPF